MAAADVRDMLDLPAEGQPRPHKKQKVVEKRPGRFAFMIYSVSIQTLMSMLRGYYSRALRASRRKGASDRHQREQIQGKAEMDEQAQGAPMVCSRLAEI